MTVLFRVTSKAQSSFWRWDCRRRTSCSSRIGRRRGWERVSWRRCAWGEWCGAGTWIPGCESELICLRSDKMERYLCRLRRTCRFGSFRLSPVWMKVISNNPLTNKY